MKLLSVDPANLLAGWSYFSDYKLMDFGLLKGTSSKTRAARYKTVNGVKHLVAKAVKLSESIPITGFQTGKLINRFHDDGCRLLIIEDQYVGKNPQTAMRVVEARMRWEVAAEVLGWKIVRVKPATWQSKMVTSSSSVSKIDPLTRKQKSDKQISREQKANRSALKQRIIERVKINHPGIVANSDESDSICMGDYYINEQRCQGKLF